jgi:steroid Delta-isomerase
MLAHQKTPEIVAAEQRTRAAVDAYLDAWKRGDKQALLALYAEDAEWTDPVGTPPMRGRAAIGEFWDKSHGGGTRMTPQLERVIVCGDEAILLFTMQVRGAKGGGMDLFVCDHFQVDAEGRIRSARAFWDTSGITPVPV